MTRSLKIATIALVAAMLIAPTLSQAHATPLYDLTGTWIWHYTYGESSEEDHTMAINFFNKTTGDFSGFGFRNDNSAYNWTVTGNEFLPESESGLICIEFMIVYDQNSLIPYYYIYATGSLSSPTYMSGTATLTLPPGGIDDVAYEEMPPSWEAAKMSPDPNVILNFPPGSDIKSVSVTEYTSANSPYPPLPGAIDPIYNITVVIGASTASLTSSSLTNGFTGLVTVGIHYDPESLGGKDPSTLVTAQFDFLLGDVNHDGKVNLFDLLIITKALFSTPAKRNWNPNCDLNGDQRVDLRDLCLALRNLGKTAKWMNRPSWVDTANSIVYCTTDHFSAFGIH